MTSRRTECTRWGNPSPTAKVPPWLSGCAHCRRPGRPKLVGFQAQILLLLRDEETEPELRNGP
eukprot:4332983-Lingulodinium_polyedra.AAC.1